MNAFLAVVLMVVIGLVGHGIGYLRGFNHGVRAVLLPSTGKEKAE